MYPDRNELEDANFLTLWKIPVSIEGSDLTMPDLKLAASKTIDHSQRGQEAMLDARQRMAAAGGAQGIFCALTHDIKAVTTHCNFFFIISLEVTISVCTLSCQIIPARVLLGTVF